MKNILLIITIISLVLISRYTFSKESDFNTCIKNADHPANNTGGPEWDDLNVKNTLSVCTSAYLNNPESKEIIRSLARIHYKNKDFSKTHNLLIKGVKKKDEYSIYLMGLLFENGEGVKKDTNKAFKFFKQSAEQGFSLAQYAVGSAYSEGSGIKQDFKKAIKWFELSATQGNQDAQNELGLAYEDGLGVKKDLNKAFKFYKLSADQGNRRGQYLIGYLYYYGKGVQQDNKKARKWFKLSAMQGHASAQSMLGYFYDNGLGGKQDVIESIKWYKMSAKQGDATSMYNIGNTYYYGEGVDQDFAEALKWFNKAAQKDEDNAIYALGYMNENGIGGIPKNLEKAMYYYNRLVEFNRGLAFHGLGRVYLLNPKRVSDEQVGINYLKDAIDNKRYEAIQDIFDHYLKKKLSIKNIKKNDQKKLISELIEILEKVLKDPDSLENVKELLLDNPEYTKFLKFSDLKNVISNLHDISEKKVNFKISDIQANEAAKILSRFYKNEVYLEKDLKKFEYYMKLRIQRNDYLASGNFGWYYFTERNDITNAEKYTKIGLKVNSNYVRASFYNNLGVFENYKNKKNLKKQIEYYENAVKIAQKNKLEKDITWPFENLARIYINPDKNQNLNMFTKYVKFAPNKSALRFIDKYVRKSGIKKIERKKLLKLFEFSALEGFLDGYIELSWFHEDNKKYKDALKWSLICNLSCDNPDDRKRAGEDIDKHNKKLSFVDRNSAKEMAKDWINSQIKRYAELSKEFNINKVKNKKIDNFGKYHALLIAVEEYDSFDKLKSPINDISRINKILIDKYNFKTQLLKNPTRRSLLKKLNEYSNNLTPSDNFILYFAGHGVQKSNEGFWLTIESEKTSDIDWVSNNTIVRKLREMKANNILVMADTCFAGTLTRGISSKSIRNQDTPLKILNNTKTRIAITSGNLEPVLDGGSGENSIFASAISITLKEFTGPFTATDLFSKIQKKVIRESVAFGNKQNPVFMDIPKSGHENFDFVFNPY